MFAKIKHMAIVSEKYTLQAAFYEAVFGMTAAAKKDRSEGAMSLSDGYVGLTIISRMAGRPGGLEHFGLEVEDIERVRGRLRERYPMVEIAQRPSTRPFASFTTHDPAGNVFDISQEGLQNRKSVYTQSGIEQQRDCIISHFALYTLHVDEMARFYREIFELEPLPRKHGDPNHYLSDGRVTLVLMPWSIRHYDGSGIVRPYADHFGFKVKSVQAVKDNLQAITDIDPQLRPLPIENGPEGRARLKLFARCTCGTHQLTDVDGTLVDVAE
jgi:predicted enzyme related to lactoylglutathione lyase